MVSESEMFEKSFDHFWFFIFLVTLATVPVSFSIYYHFLCKMFTNFSPRRHVNDFKGTYFVKKINIYQIKNSFVFTSKDPRIEEFISSAAHFSCCFPLSEPSDLWKRIENLGNGNSWNYAVSRLFDLQMAKRLDTECAHPCFHKFSIL